ncbi:MAG TPA: flagellar biosynthetic protein FliO [Limnochordia bacterium]
MIADPPDAGILAGGSGLAWALLRTFVVLILLLPAIYWVTRWYARRALGSREAAWMRVIETIALGPQRHVCLIEVAGKVLVLGVTPQAITLLTEVDDEALLSHAPRLAEAMPFSDALRRQISRLVGRGKGRGDE